MGKQEDGPLMTREDIARERARQERDVVEALTLWGAGRASWAEDGPLIFDRALLKRLQPALVGEFDVFAAAEGSVRSVVHERLPALVRARFSEERGAMARAAEATSIARPNLYRLLDRMQELGPVSGLIPHNRRSRGRSADVNGFGNAVDDWIADAMAIDPAVSIATVDRYVRKRGAEAAAADDRLELPSTSALRRRVHQLRGAVVKDPGSAGAHRLGTRILVDHCRLNIDVEDFVSQDPDVPDPGGRRGPRVSDLVQLAMAVDVETKVILAFGMYLREPGRGLRAMGIDAGTRLRALAASGAPIADRMRELRWVVPEPLVGEAAGVGATLSAFRRPLIEPVVSGEDRIGSRLVSLIGCELFSYRLLTRARDGSRISRASLGTMHRENDLKEAAWTFSFTVDRWNEAHLADLRRNEGRAVAVAEEAAGAIGDDLAGMFERMDF